MTLPPALLLEQSDVVPCWMCLGLSSLQLWRKYIGHKDLRGSGRQSVTLYVHERCMHYCVYGVV
jgi:hypothetical protein